MKFKALLLSTVLVGTLAACGTNDQDVKDKTEDTAKTEKTDVVTTASIVDNADALVKAASAEGNWIFAILNDVTMDKNLLQRVNSMIKGIQQNLFIANLHNMHRIRTVM